MKSTWIAVAGVALIALAGSAQAAGDAAAGKAKAGACAGCHGANGEGTGANPALAGKKEDQLFQSLQDYKSGKKNNAVMKTFASKLSDDEMHNIAAYYASLKGK